MKYLPALFLMLFVTTLSTSCTTGYGCYGIQHNLEALDEEVKESIEITAYVAEEKAS